VEYDEELFTEALNEENSFLLLSEWHDGQSTSLFCMEDLWSTSNLFPQSLHLYSNIGMEILSKSNLSYFQMFN